MKKIFEIFRRGELLFIAIPNGSDVSICDSFGGNYGSYYSVASFEKMAKDNGGFEKLRLGKAELRPPLPVS